MQKINLTVVTTTKDCSKHIGELISSLNEQSEKNFIWIVIDGGSIDDTLKVIANTCKISYRILSGKDFSIYHAINLGLDEITTQYYCVAGADDKFARDFISNANLLLADGYYDLIFGAVMMGGKLIRPGVDQGWLKGMHGIGSSHSIGTIVKKVLHQKFGLYSNNYPVVADQYFIKKCIGSGIRFLSVNQCFGEYSLNGFSASNKLHYQVDFFKMQIDTGENFLIQFLLFIARLIKLKLLSIVKRWG